MPAMEESTNPSASKPILPQDEETCSPQQLKARRAFMKAIGQKEGDYPLTPAAISLTPLGPQPPPDTGAGTLDLKKAKEIAKHMPKSLEEPTDPKDSTAKHTTMLDLIREVGNEVLQEMGKESKARRRKKLPPRSP